MVMPSSYQSNPHRTSPTCCPAIPQVAWHPMLPHVQSHNTSRLWPLGFPRTRVFTTCLGASTCTALPIAWKDPRKRGTVYRKTDNHCHITNPWDSCAKLHKALSSLGPSRWLYGLFLAIIDLARACYRPATGSPLLPLAAFGLTNGGLRSENSTTRCLTNPAPVTSASAG